ncbi:MAG: hypothetical protein LBT05_01780 [Planctomycetaceae bacterium]|jgi:hypothetical protein|nr:hypothetical protein [Planctomycetaceae bacterium]
MTGGESQQIFPRQKRAVWGDSRNWKKRCVDTFAGEGVAVNAVDRRGASWKLKVKNEKVKVRQTIVSITERRIPLAKKQFENANQHLAK